LAAAGSTVWLRLSRYAAGGFGLEGVPASAGPLAGAPKAPVLGKAFPVELPPK
jgi:hypothetical protein